MTTTYKAVYAARLAILRGADWYQAVQAASTEHRADPLAVAFHVGQWKGGTTANSTYLPPASGRPRKTAEVANSVE